MQKENPTERQRKNNLIFITTDKPIVIDGKKSLVTIMLIVGMVGFFLHGYVAYHYQQKLKEVAEMHQIYMDSLQIYRDDLKRFSEKLDEIKAVQ